MIRQELISSTTELITVCKKAEQHDAIGVDTEFLWERTYYPHLGLIQIGLSDEECYLIDPIAIEDLSPLSALLENSNVVKIFHDALQDLAIISHTTGINPCNIFDTQLAAAFAEFPFSLSLEKLTWELLEIPLNKSETRTNWLQRPLTEEQIRYAKDDVRYLRALRIILLERINSHVKPWLYEELELLSNPTSCELFNPTKPHKKVKGFHSLNDKDLAILKPLAKWREKTAQLKNSPRGHIVNNETMLEIAKKNPQTKTHLLNTSLTKEKVSSYGDEILKIMQNIEIGEVKKRTFTSSKPTVEEKKLLENLRKYIILKGDLLGIAPQLIGNTKELQRLVYNSLKDINTSEMRQNNGWRKLFLTDFFTKSCS